MRCAVVALRARAPSCGASPSVGIMSRNGCSSSGPKGRRSRRILALDVPDEHGDRPAGRHGQAALAHRARVRISAGVGLGHYEGRGGAASPITSLSASPPSFLISERETISPSAPPRAALGPQPTLPEGWRPRGSPAPARAPRADLDRDTAPADRRRHHQASAALPLLASIDQIALARLKNVTP